MQHLEVSGCGTITIVVVRRQSVNFSIQNHCINYSYFPCKLYIYLPYLRRVSRWICAQRLTWNLLISPQCCVAAEISSHILYFLYGTWNEFAGSCEEPSYFVFVQNCLIHKFFNSNGRYFSSINPQNFCLRDYYCSCINLLGSELFFKF